MERLPMPGSNKTGTIPALTPAPLVGTSGISSVPVTPSLRQITNTPNDKAISVPPHFRFPGDPYPTTIAPYTHSSVTPQEGFSAVSPSSSSSVSSALPPVLLQNNNFRQRDIIPATVTETLHTTTLTEPVVKDVTPTNVTNISNGASVPELLNNSNEVVTITPTTDNNPPLEGESASSNALNVIPPKSGQTYVDITEYLNMPQSDAAKKLRVPTSTLSKRWKEAVRGRKWPYRMVCKLDKEIMTLLHNIPQGPGAPPLPEEVEATLGLLIRKRSEELKSVVIRI